MKAGISFVQARVAVGCFIGVLLASGFTASFSIFLLPVSEHFKWGRSVMSSAFFFAQVIAALCYPLFGYFIDRFGARPTLGPALVIHGLSIMALSQLDGSIVQLYVLYAFLGVGVALTGYIAYLKLITGWFGRGRGTMIGLSLGAGVAIGGTLSPQLSSYLIDAVGWRNAYIWLGVPFFVLALPNLFLLKEPPAAAMRRQSAVGLSFPEALRKKNFWLLFFAILFIAVGWEGPRGHMVAMLTDRGESKEFATGVLSTVALFSAIGRVTGGVLLDRFQTPRVAVFGFGLVLAGVAILDVASGNWLLFGAVILGLGVGTEMDVMAYFVSRYFGMKDYSQIYGAIGACSVLSYGLGPMILGVAYDALGNYDLAILAMQGLIAISIVLILFLGPYVYASRNAAEADAREASPDANAPPAGEATAKEAARPA